MIIADDAPVMRAFVEPTIAAPGAVWPGFPQGCGTMAVRLICGMEP